MFEFLSDPFVWQVAYGILLGSFLITAASLGIAVIILIASFLIALALGG